MSHTTTHALAAPRSAKTRHDVSVVSPPRRAAYRSHQRLGCRFSRREDASRAPSRAGNCAFDGARLLLGAAGGGARVVVTLHEGGEGSDEEGNVVGRAVLPAVPAGCLVP